MNNKLDIDETKLTEIICAELSFNTMVKLLRQIWVLDLGSKFNTVLADNETIIDTLILAPGVWAENKEVLRCLQQNKIWWDTYFSYQQGDKIYVFRNK